MSWLDATPELLEAARATLRAEVMPALPPEQRYQGAMIGNALAIAARELLSGPGAREAEGRELAALLGDGESVLEPLRRRLCREIRAGAHDGERAAALRAVLRQAVRRRLAISNPDHLARYDG